MQWETWVEGCRDKNPAVDPRKWLETTIDQNVIMREASVRSIGDLLSGKSVPLHDFATPGYTTEPECLDQVLTQIFLWGGHLTVESLTDTDRFRAVIASEGRHRPAIGEAPDAGVTVCLAALEYADMAMNTELDDWIKDVLEKGE